MATFIETIDHNKYTISINIDNILSVENWTDSDRYNCVIRTPNYSNIYIKETYNAVMKKIEIAQNKKG